VQPTIHVENLGFPEGPVALPDSGIAFVDLLDQKIRVHSSGRTHEICKLRGSPNGMRLGGDGALYVANNGGMSPRRGGDPAPVEPQISGRIQRVTLQGEVSDFAVDLPGETPWRPNDLVFTPRGDIVFTDPQNWEELVHQRAGRGHRPYHGGQLLLAAPNGAVTRLAGCSDFPNGLAFHPDGSLIVGLHTGNRLMRYPWRGDGVGEPSIWVSFDAKFAPDGMAFHKDQLYVTGADGDRIAVIDALGRIVEMIATPPRSVPTNLCFAADRLWVTFGVSGQLASYPI
jgi:sugar lactone lactonase YvrE